MTQLKLHTAGESHGPELTAVLEGVPAGLVLDESFINRQLTRRQSGYGRSPRQKIEHDQVRISGGVRHGETIGSPIALTIANHDHKNWNAAMSVWSTDTKQGNWRDDPIHVVRPGHADLPGIARGDFLAQGLRPVLERSSARETAIRVAAGAICQQFLAQLGINLQAHVVAVGSVSSDQPTPVEHDAVWSALDQSELRACSAELDARMVQAVDTARRNKDTLGGVVEVVAWGLPPGIGGYATNRERLDGRIAGAMLSVHAMKSVTIGEGVRAAGLTGSQAHDEIYPYPMPQSFAAENDSCARVGALGGPQGMGVTRLTNHAGGIEGGMTNGAPLVVQVAMKPLPTLMQPLKTVNLSTKEAAYAHTERSDTCAISAASIVLQSALAVELAGVLREQFGAQALSDVKGAYRAYCERVMYPLREVVELA